MKVRTKDLTEAAFLWCQDRMDFLGAEKELTHNKEIVFFCFETSRTEEEYRNLKSDFFNGDATVEPRTFAQRTGDVRNILYSALRGGDK